MISSRHETAGAPASEERASTPNSSGPEGAAGGMGSSSERLGHVGPGQVGTDGVRDTSELDPSTRAATDQDADVDDAPIEGIAPKAGYPSLDPRHEDKPYRA